MLFENKICKNCGSEIDCALEVCPKCGHTDENYRELGLPKNVTMTPVSHQLLLFLVGFALLQVLLICVALILNGSLTFNDDLLKAILANTIPYFLVFTSLIFCLVKYRKSILKPFTNWRNYIIGLIFGTVLFFSSMLYFTVLETIMGGPVDVNTNQGVAESLIGNFPIVSLIVFGVIAPVCEEITYRLALFSVTLRINKYVAFIATIIVFALIHFDMFAADITIELLNLPSYILAGLFLGLAYYFGGIPASMTAHIGNNVVSIILIIIRGTYGA